MTLRNLIFLIFTALTILFAAFLCWSSFDEWWKISIKKEIGAYTWGHINDNPWYYETPATYSKVMLTEFIVLTAGFGLTIFFISKRNRQKKFYSLLGLWGLVIIMLLNGNVQ